MTRNFPKKELIIFDFDGVIYDSIGLVRKDMYRKYPQLKEEDFLEIFNGDFWRGVQKVKDKYGEPEKQDGTPIALEGEIFRGISDFVNKLKLNYILVINSSSKADNILGPLKRYDIDNCFKAIYGKEAGIDKIDKFRKIFAEQNIKPESAIFITDSVGDIRDAEALGIDTIAVTWGVHKLSDFEKVKYHNLVNVVGSIEELEKIMIKG